MAKKKSKKIDLIKAIKKNARDSQLEREKLVGKPRAKSFGGKPSTTEDRRKTKETLRRLDRMDDSR